MNKVAVVILNYNGKRLLEQFLPSVVRHSDEAGIWVADNGSTDNSIGFVLANFSSVQTIQLDKNYGFCEGYNRALRQVEAQYYILLNSDVEVTPNWLTPLIELLDQGTDIAAVQPKILSYQQRDHFEYAGAGGGFIDALGYPFCRGRIFDTVEKDSGQYNDSREVFWASGACLMVRSTVFHAMKGFDETFFAHLEEIDLCWKIQRNGLKVFYCGQSTVYHVGGGTLARSNPRKTYYNFMNSLRLICKHLPTGELIYKLPFRFVLDYLAALKFAISGNFNDAWAVLMAHIGFLRTIRRTREQRKALKEKFPFKKENMYRGSIVADYYLLRRKAFSLIVPNGASAP